jgi:hypothetical protein
MWKRTSLLYKQKSTCRHLYEKNKILPIPSQSVFDSDVFYGIWKCDIEHVKYGGCNTLWKLRQDAQTCMLHRDVDAFLQITHKTTNVLINLPSSHRLHIPAYMSFILNHSPLAPMFELIMRKIFHKACDFYIHKDVVQQVNNTSGYAMSGMHGIGKSYILRICTILAPLILENVVSAYIDVKMIQNIYPSELFNGAFQALEVPTFKQSNTLNALLGRISFTGHVVMLCVNNLHDIYENTKFWSQLHEIINAYNASLFVADSTWRLQTIIEGDSNLYNKELTRHWYTINQPSLNNTKLCNIRLYPLTSIYQYKVFLQSLYTGHHNVWTNHKINGLHTMTGGCIIQLISLLDSKSNINFPFYKTTLFDTNHIIHHVIYTLFINRYQHTRTIFDPFNVPKQTKDVILKCIQGFGDNNKRNLTHKYEQARRYPSFLLYNMLTSGILTICEEFCEITRDTLFTLSYPHTFLQVLDVCPKVNIVCTISDPTQTFKLVNYLSSFSIQNMYQPQLDLSLNYFQIILLSNDFILDIIQNKQVYHVQQMQKLIRKCSLDPSFRKKVLFVHFTNLDLILIKHSQLMKHFLQDTHLYNLSEHNNNIALVAEIFGNVQIH